MHRVDTATATAVLPAPEAVGTPGYFTKGDAVGGVAATIPGPDWFNMMQEEMVAVLDAAGVTPDQTKADYGQLLTALQALGLQDATAALKGRVELATDAEVQAGTDTARAVTPAGLASFAQNFATSGYKKFPGGFVLQWVLDSSTALNPTLTWPIAFPTACYGAAVAINNSVAAYAAIDGAGPTNIIIHKSSATGCIVLGFGR